MGQIGKHEREVEVPGPATVPDDWPDPVEEPAEPARRQDQPEEVPA
jgi:hypothetical protein